MGTNYYLEIDVCKCCMRPKEVKHIGKSSAGWCFSLHVDENTKSLVDWIDLITFHLGNPDHPCHIVDEYGRKLSLDELLHIIKNRDWGHLVAPRPKEFYDQNNAEPGPNNLIRHKIDGRHCIGHGEGTWDLIRGEFS